MKFKGVIFDLDGVLCSTDKYHYLSWKRLADRLNIYFDEQINNRLRGVSRMDSLEIVLERSNVQYSAQQKQDLADEKNNTYRMLLNNMSPDDVSADVRKTLEDIRRLGLKTAIGSSSKNTPLILQKTDLQKYFDAVSDGNNITHSKPHPEVFLKAAQMLGLLPSECVVVEDAFSGVQAAKSGGFVAAAISDATKSPQADIRLTNLSDLLKYLQ